MYRIRALLKVPCTELDVPKCTCTFHALTACDGRKYTAIETITRSAQLCYVAARKNVLNSIAAGVPASPQIRLCKLIAYSDLETSSWRSAFRQPPPITHTILYICDKCVIHVHIQLAATRKPTQANDGSAMPQNLTSTSCDLDLRPPHPPSALDCFILCQFAVRSVRSCSQVW